MKLSCKSCEQSHFIPDGRVRAAGGSGLRVRCSGCRAIMAVDPNIKLMTGEDTMPNLPTLRRSSSAPLPDLTGLRRIDEAPLALPVAVALQGHSNPSVDLSALPGISRHVTGVHCPRPSLLRPRGQGAKTKRSERMQSRQRRERRMWFVALGGKPRGPFTKSEMRNFADKGRVRGRTRVWRPGLAGWIRVRTGENEEIALSWLRDAVIERKQAEHRAARRAQTEMGVKVLQLEVLQLEVLQLEPSHLASASCAPGAQLNLASAPPPLPSEALLLPIRADDLPLAQGDASELFRSPTPVLGPLVEHQWSPSEQHAAYSGHRASRLWLALFAWAAFLAVVASYLVPAFLA